jgi:hypothetical protein
MSSLMDAIIASDNIASSAPTGSDPPQTRRERASSRPSSRGLPSESGARSVDGFPDERVVGSRGTVRKAPRGAPGDISKVVDEIGEHMVQQFEDFLET